MFTIIRFPDCASFQKIGLALYCIATPAWTSSFLIPVLLSSFKLIHQYRYIGNLHLLCRLLKQVFFGDDLVPLFASLFFFGGIISFAEGEMVKMVLYGNRKQKLFLNERDAIIYFSGRLAKNIH
jgi:hypothetical protein